MVADYIPELAHADRSAFGIAISTLDGVVYSAGEADRPFTIQSVSKPFVLALAVEELGLDAVLGHVGVEPSGESFNAISLDAGSGRPANPMINAGAIVATSLVPAGTAAEPSERIRICLSAFAGRSLDVSEAVYRSEQATGDRNRALAWLMRDAGSLRADVDETVDTYFRQCAIEVTAADVAVMAATLGNGGIGARSGSRVVSERTAEQVLAVMAACGMYDGAGEWMLRVGMPAKSGVARGLLAVSPGQFGIGLFSPPLDAAGNPVRCIAACHELSDRFGLHMVHVADHAGHVPDPPAVLEAGAVILWTLRGDIGFATAESVARRMGQGPERSRWLVLDVGRVSQMHPAAVRLLVSALASLEDRGTRTVIADAVQHDWFPGYPPCARCASRDRVGDRQGSRPMTRTHTESGCRLDGTDPDHPLPT